MRQMICGGVFVLLAVWVCVRAAEAPTTAPAKEGIEFFETRIQPVLVSKCYDCHSAGAKKLKAELRLDTHAGMLKGGESGDPAVVPGEPEKSALVAAIHYNNDDSDRNMPPEKKGGKLPEATIKDFENWIKMGAPDSRKN